MYLAPLNYDRFFKKVFSDNKIAKRFLEDFLGVTIVSLEQLPETHRVTDEASIVAFDYRCQLADGSFVIIDMQQWYKTDIVERFYLYHTLNTGLQLEKLPHRRLIVSPRTGKSRTIRDYKPLAPVLTLIWLVDDTLGFNENYIAYAPLPEAVLEFLENENLWSQADITELLKERKRVLSIAHNETKRLSFLRENRLVFMFQQNIVQQMQGEPYERWFRFAEKSRHRNNEAVDFEEFLGDEVFEEMIRRLNQTELTEEEFEYIEDEEEIQRILEWQVRRIYGDDIEEKFRREGWTKGLEEGLEAGIKEGREVGIKEGLEAGIKEGKEVGIKEGREVGIKEARQDACINNIALTLAFRFGVERDHLLPQLRQLSVDRLEQLVETAFVVDTLTEFEMLVQ